MNPFSLEGKNIIVTGASSGLGRQTAITCSELGARIILIGRNEERLLETVSSLCHPEKHIYFPVDITDYSALEVVIKDAAAVMSKFHGLVNAAGISTTLPLKLLTTEKLDTYFHTNVHASINMTKLFSKLSYLPEEGASVIFISSVMGMVGEVGKTMYSLTKGALIAGAKSLALELAGKKIRVNTISPGVVVTPMSQKAAYSRDEESLNKVTALHPLGLGLPEDVANACAYLLSDASRWVTGTNLVVDGGYTAR
ncbi:MAG: SDR family oxidoreductase [Bacteroidota bacterium]